MLANNEVGTLQPVREIAAAAKERGIVVHTDAVQAVGKLPVDVDELGVDLLSMSSHKIYGPKGAGFLYVRRGVTFDPLSHGGSHEWSVRAGTENVAGIVGLATALKLAVDAIPSESARLSDLTALLESGIVEGIPEVSINGHPIERLPGTLNVAIPLKGSSPDASAIVARGDALLPIPTHGRPIDATGEVIDTGKLTILVPLQGVAPVSFRRAGLAAESGWGYADRSSSSRPAVDRVRTDRW